MGIVDDQIEGLRQDRLRRARALAALAKIFERTERRVLKEKAAERQRQAEASMKKPRDAKVTPKRERPRCGARTRRGTLCQARAVWDEINDRPRVKNGRCRMHGGLTPKWAEIGRDSLRWKRK